MTVTQKEMLDVANQHTAAAQARQVKLGKTILEVPQGELAPIPPARELDLTEREKSDPFAGNINNRRVAERIAGERKQWLNPHVVTHKGDPVKAAEDVRLSKELNPDALSHQELSEAETNEAAAKGKKPTPGSPAATARQTPSPSDADANAGKVASSAPSPASGPVPTGAATGAPAAWTPPKPAGR